MKISTRNAKTIRDAVLTAQRHVKIGWTLISNPNKENLAAMEACFAELEIVHPNHVLWDKTYGRIMTQETLRSQERSERMQAQIDTLEGLTQLFDQPATVQKPVLRSGFHD